MKLNLGCGSDYKEGWINADIKKEVCDIALDMNKKLPFADNTFDYIYAKYCIEHIKKECFPKLMNELFRISKKGCIIHIIVPLNNYWHDPTHKNPTGYYTFRYFKQFKIKQERVYTDVFGTIPKLLSYIFPFNILHQSYEVYLEPVK
jgi:predicted SAM-dependent methyltransferase